jgi:hypothetical protein
MTTGDNGSHLPKSPREAEERNGGVQCDQRSGVGQASFPIK